MTDTAPRSTPTIITAPVPPIVPEHERAFLLARREAMLMELRAIERYLGLAVSRPSRRSDQAAHEPDRERVLR